MKTLVLLGCACLAACTTLSKAPDGSPRVEAEIVTLVGPAARDALIFDSLSEPVESHFAAIVEPMSDVGTRLYAVPADAYESDHAQAYYVLTIELTEFTAMLLEKEIEVEEGHRLTTSVDSIRCTATAKFERRRTSGPTLSVGSSTGSSELWPDRDRDQDAEQVQTIPLRHQPGTGEYLEVWQDDFEEVVEHAVLRALKGLEGPIDRELSLRALGL